MEIINLVMKNNIYSHKGTIIPTEISCLELVDAIIQLNAGLAKRKMDKRRSILVNKFRRSDEPALRVFAEQLKLVKY